MHLFEDVNKEKQETSVQQRKVHLPQIHSIISKMEYVCLILISNFIWSFNFTWVLKEEISFAVGFFCKNTFACKKVLDC